MAFLQQDPASGRFRIRFYFGGVEFKRSLKTNDEKTAFRIQERVEKTIRLLEQGRLEIPAGADPGTFILSDGKLTGKPVVTRGTTLAELFSTYRAKYPGRVKESTTAYGLLGLRLTAEYFGSCEKIRQLLNSTVRSQRRCQPLNMFPDNELW